MNETPSAAKGETPDVAIIAMTDEDIRKATSDFSYDLKQCRTRLKARGDWNKVIQAHLFYDHVLTRIIEEGLQRPDHLNLDRTVFAAKLDLAAAMGLIRDEEKGFLRAVNSLRNDIAHDLQFAVNRSHAKHLYGLMPKRFRELVDETRIEEKGTLLFGTLFVFAILLDLTRQTHAARRLHEHRGRLKLAKAVEKAQKVLGQSGAPSRGA